MECRPSSTSGGEAEEEFEQFVWRCIFCAGK